MGRLSHRTAPGFIYFVTTKAWQSQPVFQVRENAEILVGCLAHYRDQGFYLLHEFVVMPNHIHLILTPAVDASLEKAMQLIKGRSSHDIHQQRGCKSPIWQSGFHEESIRNVEDYSRKVEYIRMNPVRAHLVEMPESWPFSSIACEFGLDAAPERLRGLTPGAKAPVLTEANMSELKLRPPKNLG